MQHDDPPLESGRQDSKSPYDHFWNPLGAQLESEQKAEVHAVVCAWSDLLGFGGPFVQAEWKPSKDTWASIAARLKAAYTTHCRHTPSFGEFMLTLNDGVVRSRVVTTERNECLFLSLWLRAAVCAHLDVNASERSSGFPGTRTVITAGERAFYSFPEVRLDDTVINYTRKAPGLSEIARRTGNPLLICNPQPLQMNTAFSKAFILDEAGSKAGLKGPNVYIDDSLLKLTRAICVREGCPYRVVEAEQQGDHLFAVEYVDPPEGRPWCFGLLLDRAPGKVSLNSLSTDVFHLKKFFPNDENPKDFCFDLTGTNSEKEK